MYTVSILSIPQFSSNESLSIAIVGNKKDKPRKVTTESGENVSITIMVQQPAIVHKK